VKTCFSLKEIADMPIQQLHGLIFTLDKKVSEKDISKVDQITTRFAELIQGLKCMRGIEKNFIPSFKFFQFKKSKIMDLITNTPKIMLCFSDIS
jgi:hypothetical protein